MDRFEARFENEASLAADKLGLRREALREGARHIFKTNLL